MKEKFIVKLSALALVLAGLTGCAPAGSAGGAGAEGGGMSNMYSILLIVAMVAIFYFMLIRPQRKEQKRKAEMLSQMEVGDTILTTSGFYGILIDIDEDGMTVVVEFGNNKNCRIPMQKGAIAAVEKASDAYEPVQSKKEKAAKEEPAKEEPKAEEANSEESKED